MTRQQRKVTDPGSIRAGIRYLLPASTAQRSWASGRPTHLPLLPQIGHVFLVFTVRVPGVYDACARAIQAWRQGLALKAGALNPPARGAADLGSVLGFVLERELELGAIGDRAPLV